MDAYALEWLSRVAWFNASPDEAWRVKTIRFQLSVLALDEASDLLDLVTSVDGVAAALLDAASARLDVIVTSDACGLLVQEEIRAALSAGLAAA